MNYGQSSVGEKESVTKGKYHFLSPSWHLDPTYLHSKFTLTNSLLIKTESFESE